MPKPSYYPDEFYQLIQYMVPKKDQYSHDITLAVAVNSLREHSQVVWVEKDIQERGLIYPLRVNEEEYLTLFTAGSEPFTLIMTN